MINYTLYQDLKKDLDYAYRNLEDAKNHTPNFGKALVNSLAKISDVVVAIPIFSMDFESFFELNLHLTRLHGHLSAKGLEKEAKLAEKISTNLINRYSTSHL